MTKHSRLAQMMACVMGAALVAFVARTVFMPTEESAEQRADQLVAQWGTEYTEHDLYTKTPIHLGFSRALSKKFTKATGKAEINFQTGRVSVSVDGLDPLSDGSVYEVWLIRNGRGLRNTAGIDTGEDGDQILKLGTLAAHGTLVASVPVETLASVDIDMAAVMRVAADRTAEYTIGGMQSIRFQIGRTARINRNATTRNFLAAGFDPTPLLSPALARGQSGNSKKVSTLIAEGRHLFFNATFGGNGRTCGTCHRATNELTIDAGFIASLPPTDPLFVSEFSSGLPGFNSLNPRQPAMEDLVMLRTRGLVLENIAGFEVDPATGELRNAPVFRATPSLFNLDVTGPYGLSNCCLTLQDFTVGAVVQHFTKTLDRIPGADFVLPAAGELQALEAFMLANASPANRNFKIAGRNSLLSTRTDRSATDTTRPEVRGRDLFETVGCAVCHLAPVGAAGSDMLNTGVEVLEHLITHANATPTVDTGDGNGQFQVPQIFGLRKSHFFHSGLRGNITVAIAGQTLRFTNLRDAVSFYVTPAFAESPAGLAAPGTLAGMSKGDIDDIAHFLEAISNP